MPAAGMFRPAGIIIPPGIYSSLYSPPTTNPSYNLTMSAPARPIPRSLHRPSPSLDLRLCNQVGSRHLAG